MALVVEPGDEVAVVGRRHQAVRELEPRPCGKYMCRCCRSQYLGQDSRARATRPQPPPRGGSAPWRGTAVAGGNLLRIYQASRGRTLGFTIEMVAGKSTDRSGLRFGFGANWSNYSAIVGEDRIAEAERSLADALGGPGALSGKTFLDIGCGSGLFSLAAIRLGAEQVRSFDYDIDSVATTELLKQRFAADADNWTVSEGNALDRGFVDSLGQFDVVYSWGVLHHTGDMWAAMENAGRAVAPDGLLFISIYNDQGLRSRLWRGVKRIYCALPSSAKTPYVVAVMLPRELLSLAANIARGRPLAYVRSWTQYKRQRGMSRWHDLVDWVGGYPFDVAAAHEVFAAYRNDGFRLERMKTVQGLGCNEFVFRR
jgi:2-polyprenyl-3-methyl-5-hydroxy-6-metoxy-1,4-benzoquinol methylase